VTVIEGASILNREGADAVAILRDALAREGIVLLEGAAAKFVRAGAGEVVVDCADRRVAGSHLLVAAGRRANVAGLDLERAGVRGSERGVEVNDRLQTANPRIYAMGDAAGGPQYTHLAGDHASTIIRNIIFKIPAKRRDHLAPRAVYTDPELASVGLSEAEAKSKDSKSRAVRWTFQHNDRAIAERDEDGFIKIVCDSRSRMVGATIVGRNAGDLIHPCALAVANKMKIGAFTNYIAPYPTRGEVLKRAAGQWFTPALFSQRTRFFARLLAAFD
jgi:pyruvate/2-oxoglutarate dehydrogenase complex dihydrolipoamide dehydrogenase (E3) component